MFALGHSQGSSLCCFWNMVPPLLPAQPTLLGSLLLGSVGDGAIFKEPLLCGKGHGCKLTVKHSVFILRHDEILGDDHCPRKALICNGRDHRRVKGPKQPVVSLHQCSRENSKKSWVHPASTHRHKGGRCGSTAVITQLEHRTA